MTTALDLNWYERDSVVDFKRYFLEMAIKCSTTRERVIKEVADIILQKVDDNDEMDCEGNAAFDVCEMASNFWVDCECLLSYSYIYCKGDYYTPDDEIVSPIYGTLTIKNLRLYSTISNEYEIDLCEVFNISEEDVKLCKR